MVQDLQFLCSKTNYANNQIFLYLENFCCKKNIYLTITDIIIIK